MPTHPLPLGRSSRLSWRAGSHGSWASALPAIETAKWTRIQLHRRPLRGAQTRSSCRSFATHRAVSGAPFAAHESVRTSSRTLQRRFDEVMLTDCGQKSTPRCGLTCSTTPRTRSALQTWQASGTAKSPTQSNFGRMVSWPCSIQTSAMETERRGRRPS